MSADDVIGYLTPCEACGERALTRRQHGAGWRCPTCTDFAAQPQPMTVPTLDPLAAAIWREVGDRLEQPRVVARVGDQYFMLRKITVGAESRSEVEWVLEPDLDKQLAPWAVADDADYPLGQVQG